MSVRIFIICCLALLGACATKADRPVSPPRLQSEYVTMRDSVDLAVDVWTPASAELEKVPAIILFTRYWRARDVGSTNPGDDVNFERAVKFSAAGYALVMVDVRGSGASFGERRAEFSPEEIQDLGEVVEWIAAQPWSNGRVAAMGSSYLGNTAELAAIHGGLAFRAAVPRFSDYDLYRYAVFPGGVPNTVLLNAWASIVASLDSNEKCAYGPDTCGEGRGGGVKPVTGSENQLDMAVLAHEKNLDVSTLLDTLTFIDDSASADSDPKVTLSSVSPSALKGDLDKAGVPMQFWVSWYDAATADGALSRYMTSKAPMQLIIGPWNHGATVDANPYTPFDVDYVGPSVSDQYGKIFEFLDPLMKGDTGSEVKSRIDYFTVGANKWQVTDTWPPAGVQNISLYAGLESTLATSVGAAGKDTYTVDYSIISAPKNRWTTQLGEPVDYSAWTSDGKLSFTSAPLKSEVEITGQPVVELWLESSAPDGALHVYLEDVAEDGKATYLTEGVFRLQHRKVSAGSPDFHVFGPFHSFKRADAAPMPEGAPENVAFNLLPISATLARGHRIRVSVAGADASAFGRIPAIGDAPVYGLHYGGVTPTRIDLPVMTPAAFEFEAADVGE
ncbi:MAG: CocE/NonD family hydrolase [Hyphomonas sp.]|nr:CocE/NonD family hydrolase [Hyphomonas sp.]